MSKLVLDEIRAEAQHFIKNRSRHGTESVAAHRQWQNVRYELKTPHRESA